MEHQRSSHHKALFFLAELQFFKKPSLALRIYMRYKVFSKHSVIGAYNKMPQRQKALPIVLMPVAIFKKKTNKLRKLF